MWGSPHLYGEYFKRYTLDRLNTLDNIALAFSF